MAARTLEMEFLPAALEVEQTPALPMARLMIWAIVLFFFVSITWACVSRVDIVGVAPGKIVPSGRTKTIQPLERSVVVAIHVADGQHVQAGEVLVELDPTAPTADRDRLSDEQMTYALDRTRLTGLLAAVRSEGGEVIETKPLPDPFGDLAKRAEPTLLGKQRAHFAEQLAEYRAAMAGLQEEIKQKQSERAGVESRIAQLDATLPLITEEADSNKKLMGGGMVPRVKWLELERNRIEQQQERDVQRHWHTQLGAVLASLAHKSQVTAAQYRSRWMSEQADAETRIASYSEEIAKAKHRCKP